MELETGQQRAIRAKIKKEDPEMIKVSGKAEVECERKRRLAALLETAKHGPGGKPS